MFYLLELQQEGALVLAPAVLLHPLLDELVEDRGDGLGADPLQQVQSGTTNTLETNMKHRQDMHCVDLVDTVYGKNDVVII